MLKKFIPYRKSSPVPGIDRQNFEHIENEIGVEVFLSSLREEIRTERYHPQPVLRCWIDKLLYPILIVLYLLNVIRQFSDITGTGPRLPLPRYFIISISLCVIMVYFFSSLKKGAKDE